MEMENDLIKYRLVRLLLTSWFFPLLAFLALILFPSFKLFAVILMIVGVLAAAQLTMLIFHDGERLTKFGLFTIAILGVISLISNFSYLVMIMFMSTLSPETDTQIKEQHKKWFPNEPEKKTPKRFNDTYRPQRPPLQNSYIPKTVDKTSVTVSLSEIRRFLFNHFRAQETENIDMLMKDYADQVIYNNIKCNMREIRSIKATHGKYWAVKEITPLENIRISKTSDGAWICKVEVKSRYESKQGNTIRTDEEDHRYQIEYIRSQLRIVEESRKLTSTKENQTSPTQPTLSRKQIIDFIDDTLTDEASRNAAWVLKRYTPIVENYFGKRLSAQEVMRDKAQYYKRWPIWHEEPDNSTIMVNQSGNRWTVRFQSTFRASSQSRQKTSSGTVQNTYILRYKDNTLRIIAQDGKVTLNK